MAEQELRKSDFTKHAIVTVVGIVILGGTIYAAYRYSQMQTNNIILPGGVTYLGPSSSPTLEVQPPTAPLLFTADPDVTWSVYTGKLYPYSFSYPPNLPLAVFPGDTMDSVAIAWGNIPPQLNILLNIEFIDKRDAAYLSKPQIEYVKDWHKFFSGLKGLKKVESFTNSNNLHGYKASYLNYADAAPNLDIFFEVPNHPEMMIHLANGILETDIFDRLIDSLSFMPPTPTMDTTSTY